MASRYILSAFKNKIVSKEMAVSIVIKFAMQENIFYDFVEEIKNIKPYIKGNDNIKYVIGYAVSLSATYGHGIMRELFFLPLRDGRSKKKNIDWEKINNKWAKIVGNLQLAPLNLSI